jgi:hypothetical protein
MVLLYVAPRRSTFPQRSSGVVVRITSLPGGRGEERIVKSMSVDVCPEDGPTLKERTLTQNISSHGARVLMERKLRPGQRVSVLFPTLGVESEARVIYCQRLVGNRFAVGLELPMGVEL